MTERAARAVVAVACAYEVVAITTRRVPTITALNHRWPMVGGGILAGLAWHFREHDR